MQLAYTFLLMLLPALAYSSQQQPSALKNAPVPPQLEVQAYILMDYETGLYLQVITLSNPCHRQA